MPNKRLPNEIKRSRGTLNVTRDGDRAEMIISERVMTIPPCPEFFNKFQAAEWQSVWSYLIEYRLAAPVDFSLIASYCMEMGKYLQLVKEIGSDYTVINPKGYTIENPLNAVANKALMNALRLGAEFGFTPVSRSRIVVQKDKDPKNDFENLVD